MVTGNGTAPRAGGGWLERRCVNRPLEYRSAVSWLLAGGGRDLRSLTVGWLLGWGLLPLSVIGFIGGGILGAIAGFGGSTAAVKWISDAPVVGVFVTWAWSALGGVLGALVGLVIGAILGAVFAFLFIPAFLLIAAYQSGGALQALMVGALFVLLTILIGLGRTIWAIFSEGPSASIRGYRRMSRREAEQLVPLVHDCAERLGLRNAPRILIDDSAEANAYALTRHIVITRGLLEMTESYEDALAGVICHELTHWRNADVVSALTNQGLALPAYGFYNLASGRLGWVLAVFVVPLRWCMRYVFLPVQARASREAEYRADQGAVSGGHAYGLLRALETFRELESGRTGWDEAICATHPPIELRVERLAPHAAIHPLMTEPTETTEVDLSSARNEETVDDHSPR